MWAKTQKYLFVWSIGHFCAKSPQGKHLVVVRCRQPGADVPVPVTCPPADLPTPHGFVPPRHVWYLSKAEHQEPGRPVGFQGLCTAVALSTASYSAPKAQRITLEPKGQNTDPPLPGWNLPAYLQVILGHLHTCSFKSPQNPRQSR